MKYISFHASTVVVSSAVDSLRRIFLSDRVIRQVHENCQFARCRQSCKRASVVFSGFLVILFNVSAEDRRIGCYVISLCNMNCILVSDAELEYCCALSGLLAEMIVRTKEKRAIAAPSVENRPVMRYWHRELA